MTNRTVAARYARALFDVSVKDRDPQQVDAELARFSDLVDGHETLRRLLLSPALPTARKRAIVAELLVRLGEVLSPVSKLVMLLAERDRFGLLPDILRSYRARLRDHLGVVQAQVTTAKPLTPERTAAIKQRLADASGCKVSLTTDVEPELLGGVVARVGTTVYDASVVRHLERIRETLVER